MHWIRVIQESSLHDWFENMLFVYHFEWCLSFGDRYVTGRQCCDCIVNHADNVFTTSHIPLSKSLEYQFLYDRPRFSRGQMARGRTVMKFNFPRNVDGGFWRMLSFAFLAQCPGTDVQNHTDYRIRCPFPL